MLLTDAGVEPLTTSQRMTAAAMNDLSAVQRRANQPYLAAEAFA
jgi:hypothetical protein